MRSCSKSQRGLKQANGLLGFQVGIDLYSIGRFQHDLQFLLVLGSSVSLNATIRWFFLGTIGEGKRERLCRSLILPCLRFDRPLW